MRGSGASNNDIVFVQLDEADQTGQLHMGSGEVVIMSGMSESLANIGAAPGGLVCWEEEGTRARNGSLCLV